MTADPAILKRIRGCPFARGGRVLVRFRANGDCLCARRSREPLARLRLTGNGDEVVLLYPSHRGGWGARRLRRQCHAARRSAPVPQRQSILLGTAPDLQLSHVSISMQKGNIVPWKLQNFKANLYLITHYPQPNLDT